MFNLNFSRLGVALALISVLIMSPARASFLDTVNFTLDNIPGSFTGILEADDSIKLSDLTAFNWSIAAYNANLSTLTAFGSYNASSQIWADNAVGNSWFSFTSGGNSILISPYASDTLQSTSQSIIDTSMLDTIDFTLDNYQGSFTGKLEADGTINLADLIAFNWSITGYNASLNNLNSFGSYNANTQTWRNNGVSNSWFSFNAGNNLILVSPLFTDSLQTLTQTFFASPVPLPTAPWMFLGGLMGLLGWHKALYKRKT